MAMEAIPPGLDAFRDRIAGRAWTPADPGYAGAREIYNSMHDLRPAVVVEAEGPDDVAATVALARDTGLPLAVRGGGHSLPGLSSCGGGIMLSLRRMADIEVDRGSRIARVGGGALWGEVNDATYAHGLATPGGLVTTTGVGGFTTGGGFSLISRAHGLACDNLVGAEIVTADASVVECGAGAHPDLFWAIRGGGGNFGVVTRFDLRLHPIRDVVGGLTVFPLEPRVIAGYRALIAESPREFSAYLGLTVAPPAPFIPTERHGSPVAVLLSCWCGEADGHDAILEAAHAWGPVLGRQVGPMPYPVINTLFDEVLPFGMRHYWKSIVTRSVPDAALDAYVAAGEGTPNPASGIFFHPIDGACHDLATSDTAWPHRDASWLVGVYGSWHEASRDDANRAWVRRSHAALREFADGSEYVNFATGEDPEAARVIYGPAYARLADVKRRYDPDNLFRLNQNVQPAA